MFYRTLASILFLFLPVTLLAVDIDGEVHLGSQRGLAKPATVQLLRDQRVVYEQFTDLDGRFEFHSVEPTRYVVRAIYDDMPEADVVIDAAEGNPRYRVPITITPPKEKVDKTAATVSVDQLAIPRAATREFEKAEAEKKAGRCVKAIPHYEKAIELAPRYGEAFNNLGNCLKQQGKITEAETAYQKAIDLNATIYAAINLSDLYAGQKQFDQAQQVIEASIKRNPAEGDLYFALAQVQFDQGRIKEAEEAGLQAHSHSHRIADVHLLLAKIYLAAKKYSAVSSQLETYLKENPTGPVAAEVRKTLNSLRQP